MNKLWSEMNKTMQAQIKKKDTYEAGIITLFDLRDQLMKTLMSFNEELSGLFENDNMIGMALGHIKHWYEGTEYWIDEFGILPPKQRRGLGTEFLTEIEKALTDKGIIFIALLTERTIPAYDFYKRNGFDEKETTSFFVKRIY